jgi:hypothetical protein
MSIRIAEKCQWKLTGFCLFNDTQVYHFLAAGVLFPAEDDAQRDTRYSNGRCRHFDQPRVRVTPLYYYLIRGLSILLHKTHYDTNDIVSWHRYAGNAGDLLRRQGEPVYICVETDICLTGAEGEIWYKPLPPQHNSTMAAVALLNPQAKNGSTIDMQLTFEELPILQGAR